MRCTSTHKGLQCERTSGHDGVHDASNVDDHSWSWWTDSPGTVPGQTVEGETSEDAAAAVVSSTERDGEAPGPGCRVIDETPARVEDSLGDEDVERLLREIGEKLRERLSEDEQECLERVGRRLFGGGS